MFPVSPNWDRMLVTRVGLIVPSNPAADRKSTRLNSTHLGTSYAVFCLKKKNDQIKEMTRKVSAEVDLVNQQTQNKRYGSSHIGATAKDISNVVTDVASGVDDLFHGID